MYDTYEHGDYTKHFETELFPFYYNSKFGFADAEGNVVIAEKYDEVSLFSEGKAFVKSDETWKVIDSKGNELGNVPKEFDCSNSLFRNNQAIIAQCIRVGYNDYDLSVLVIDENMKTTDFKKNGGFQLEAKVINTPERR